MEIAEVILRVLFFVPNLLGTIGTEGVYAGLYLIAASALALATLAGVLGTIVIWRRRRIAKT